MGCALVLVVQVVGVLPDVEGEDGLEAVGHRVIGVGILGNGQFSFLVGLQPYPAAAEQAHAFGLEIGLEGVYVAPLLGYLLCERRFRVKPGMRDLLGGMRGLLVVLRGEDGMRGGGKLSEVEVVV